MLSVPLDNDDDDTGVVSFKLSCVNGKWTVAWLIWDIKARLYMFVTGACVDMQI